MLITTGKAKKVKATVAGIGTAPLRAFPVEF